MATLTLNDARRTMSRNRPWTFRLEYHGGGSHKFWMATGRGRNEPVEVLYGRVGSKPQIIVKDWTYLESKTPEKVAKGYSYVDTPYVRVRQATIDAFAARSGTTNPKPAPAPSPVPKPTPAAPTPDTWRCNKGKVTVTRKGRIIQILFDVFPAAWQGAVFHTFKDDLEAFCTKHMGRKVGTWWGGSGSEEFHAHCADKGLFDALVLWLQQSIGGNKTPQIPVPALTGPLANIVSVKPVGGGMYHALDSFGCKVVTLPSTSARQLVRDHAHISVVGL